MPGPRQDLTTGPIGRTLIAFALPTLASSVLQSLNGSINTVWIGRYLGENALAASSSVNLILFLAFGAVVGFGIAATVLIGRSVGARDLDAARRTFGSAAGMVFIGSAVVAMLGWAFAPEILHVLATPARAMPFALAYLRVIFLSLPAGMVLVLMMAALRGAGDSLTPLWFMILSVLIDGGLNPVLIDGLLGAPRMGIAGAATATLIANHVCVLALGAYMVRRDLPLRLRGAEWRYLIPERGLVGAIVRQGLPIGAQMLVMSTAGLTMVGLVNRLGVDTAAAYGVTQQLWTYIQMPALSIGAGVSAMVAQSIGAGRWERVDSITRSGLLLVVAGTTIIIIAILAFDTPIEALFLPAGSPAMSIGRHIQMITSWNFILFGTSMVLFSTVRANGAVMAPLLILLVAMYPVRLGFALTALPRVGSDALWFSFPIGSTVSVTLATLYYRYGGWRRPRLLRPRAAHVPPGNPVAGEEPAGMMQTSD